MLASRNRVAIGSVDDDNTAFGRCVQVDVVNTDASAADDLQISRGFHDFFSNFRLAANKQSVVVGNDLDELILR
ncbi:hypothetical protein D3C77_582740 [compost metagenome]